MKHSQEEIKEHKTLIHEMLLRIKSRKNPSKKTLKTIKELEQEIKTDFKEFINAEFENITGVNLRW